MIEMTRSRIAIALSAAIMSLSLAGAPAFAEDTMKKDTMSKDSMSKDSMSKDSMKKDTMNKDGTAKDAMSKDNVSKDSMSKDNMKKKGAPPPPGASPLTRPDLMSFAIHLRGRS